MIRNDLHPGAGRDCALRRGGGTGDPGPGPAGGTTEVIRVGMGPQRPTAERRTGRCETDKAQSRKRPRVAASSGRSAYQVLAAQYALNQSGKTDGRGSRRNRRQPGALRPGESFDAGWKSLQRHNPEQAAQVLEGDSVGQLLLEVFQPDDRHGRKLRRSCRAPNGTNVPTSCSRVSGPNTKCRQISGSNPPSWSRLAVNSR